MKQMLEYKLIEAKHMEKTCMIMILAHRSLLVVLTIKIAIMNQSKLRSTTTDGGADVQAERQTNKLTQTDKQTSTKRDRESERSGEANTLAQRRKGREGKAARKADRHVLDKTDKTARTDGPTERQTDKQTTRRDKRTQTQTEPDTRMEGQADKQMD